MSRERADRHRECATELSCPSYIGDGSLCHNLASLNTQAATECQDAARKYLTNSFCVKPAPSAPPRLWKFRPDQ